MNGLAREHLRILGDARGPALRNLGLLRIAVIIILACGANALLRGADRYLLAYLLPFYAFGVLSGVWYIVSLARAALTTKPLLTWVQLLVDFGVVAATVSFTGGLSSPFAFLFVIVILEAGLLLGLAQGFLYATLAAAFMVTQLRIPPDATGAYGKLTPDVVAVMRAYDIVIQVLAYYLTASISGYWNQRVRRMQQFQREILDNMSDGFLLADRDGRVAAMNRAANRMLGLGENEAIGRHVHDLLRAADGGESPLAAALRTGRDYTGYEYECALAPDHAALLGLTTSCIRRRDGRLTGLIASFNDLTEIARMRAELQRQDRLAAVGELSGGLAHEIRNPVAAIRGAVEELSRDLSDPRITQRLAAIALRECDRLNAIISAFADFAREPRFDREPVDVCALLDDLRDAALEEWGDRFSGTFQIACETRPVPVAADRKQLRQVFLDLARNAVEAMDYAGPLTVTVERAETSVVIRFDDEGPGIPPDQVAQLFKPFYSTKPSAVGMGLAVCLRVVTAHNGTIHVSPRENGGARVAVRLPLAPNRNHPQED